MIQIAIKNVSIGGKDVPAVTSLQIAENFGKEHKHVLRDIRDIIENDEDGFGESNFGLSSYVSGQNKEMPMYVMTRDGFTLLVMGYTGKEAMRMKKAYIARFNEMEEQIKQATQLPNFSNPAEAARAWAIEYEEKMKALETVEQQKPMVMVAEERIEKKGCLSITDVTKSLGLKRGEITNWAKAKGFIHKRLCEVNKAGEEYFKGYSTDKVHNQIGITEEGLRLIKFELLPF